MRILIGCSGGLDSSFAARLLCESNEVCGASLIMNDHTDLSLAKASCDQLGIPFVSIDARELFGEKVVSDFVNEYSRGRTPNPCVICNRDVKLAALCDYAAANGYDRVATGHYCDVGCENERYYIRRGADEKKDQSYMLWRLDQKQLSMLITPLACHTKDEVRNAARSEGLISAEQKESQDICFIPDGDYIGFIKRIKGDFPDGDFIDEDGRVLGRHKGIINYTVGQRKGLGIALGQPMFVTKINAQNNTVTLAPSGKGMAASIIVSDLVFQAADPALYEYEDLFVKIRYAAKPVPCKVAIKDGRAYVDFEAPQRAPTPGQSAVFYEGDKLAFGGFIDEIRAN